MAPASLPASAIDRQMIRMGLAEVGERRLADVADHDPGAMGDQRVGDRPADPAGAGGDARPKPGLDASNALLAIGHAVASPRSFFGKPLAALAAGDEGADDLRQRERGRAR